MPWSMIHLSIANQIYGAEANPSFLLGSIAPDAVLVREKGKVSKSKSHLLNKATGQTEDFVTFYESQSKLSTDVNFKPFLLGYISHIVADINWGMIKKAISQMQSNPINDLLWDEENQNDFNLFRTVPWKDSVIDQIMHAPIYELTSLYTSNELHRWRKQVFDWFDVPSNEPQVPITYLTKDVVEAFIVNTADELKELFIKLK
ncbi:MULTISPECIES: zinc dependent phospholipase C family protein [unclassified Paenibacillus]|uniref:zinc dependent phospholipase C family protein n=1 Tax=unclassified Paenibacillus TaxID=185978 RepID=UPI00363BF505